MTARGMPLSAYGTLGSDVGPVKVEAELENRLSPVQYHQSPSSPTSSTPSPTASQYGKRLLPLALARYDLRCSRTRSFCACPRRCNCNGICFRFLVHGSLARAGKVKSQTPKVEKQEKKKTPKGRAKKRMVYNRRCVLFRTSKCLDEELTVFAAS